MENTPKSEQPKHRRKSNAYILVAGAAALALGTGLALKTCIKGDRDDQPKLEEKAEDEEFLVKPAPLPTDVPRFVIPSPGPDANVVGADDTSQASPDVEELTIEQACQELKNVTEEDDATVIYPLLKNIMSLLENDIAMESGYESFRKIAESCNFSTKQFLDILKIAINQGDTRVADLVNDLIKKKCRDKKSELTDQHFKKYMEGLKSCSGLPMEDIDGRKKCVQDAIERKGQRQEEAKDFAENQCPSETAADWGLDQDKVEELAALGYANDLATGRLVLMNPNVTPSEDDIMAYMVALRPLVVHLNGPAILEALGVKDETEFKKKYFDDVAESLKKQEGELYKKSAHLLETLYGLKEVLGDF